MKEILSDEENGKVNSWTQEFNCSNIEDDKLITLLKPSELCKKETGLYKDICVDEGILHEETILFDENNNNKMLKPELLTVSTIDLTVNEPINDQDLQNSKLDSEERGTHEEVFDSTVSKELISKAIGPVVSLQPGEEQDRPLPSLKSLLEAVDPQPSLSPADKTEQATSSGATKLEDAGPDNVPLVNRGVESSLSVAGPTSGLVTYSGHIGFSGSTSNRSDSSTTSTRSFAFPILQNEWNSSPIRMAKADRRQLQKRRGCRHGLLCFRF